ncbi:hypothetical protein ZEAMMB73_Zm00001d018430 [Zea mays]|nr:hypothetical protein ZEAMMB73_Zm00001d018430 [Zea mays]
MKAIKYGSVPVQISFPSDESRESEEHDWHNTALSQYIISTYGDPSLSQVLDDFNNDPLHCQTSPEKQPPVAGELTLLVTEKTHAHTRTQVGTL